MLESLFLFVADESISKHSSFISVDVRSNNRGENYSKYDLNAKKVFTLSDISFNTILVVSSDKLFNIASSDSLVSISLLYKFNKRLSRFLDINDVKYSGKFDKSVCSFDIKALRYSILLFGI